MGFRDDPIDCPLILSTATGSNPSRKLDIITYNGGRQLHQTDSIYAEQEMRYAVIIVAHLTHIPLLVTNNAYILPGVLGGTGSVGQRFALLLDKHPHFTLCAIGASERSAGKKYKDAVKWKQSMPMSPELGALTVRPCEADKFDDCDIIFSGLDSDVAGEIGKHEPYRLSMNHHQYFIFLFPPPVIALTRCMPGVAHHHQQRWNSSKPNSPSFPTQRTTVLRLTCRSSSRP